MGSRTTANGFPSIDASSARMPVPDERIADPEPPFLDAIEAELLDARRELTRLADRADALAALFEIVRRTQREVGFEVRPTDLLARAAMQGEVERAHIQSLYDRITAEDER